MNTPNGKKRIQLAILLGCMDFRTFYNRYVFTVIPHNCKDFDTTASLVQLSLTSCLLGLGLGQLVIGPLSDVKGRRKPLLFFIALYLLASVTCSIAPNIYFLILARLIQGFAAAGGLVISRAIVRDLFSGRELTKFFTMMVLVGNLGPIVAPIAGGGILAFTNWHGVFVALTCVGAVLLITVTFKLEETLPEENRVPSNLSQIRKNFGSLFKDRMFMGYAFTQGFTTAGIFAYVSGISFVYQNIYGVTPNNLVYYLG